MLGSGLVISLHELRAMGKSIRQIARETNVSRNTVRKYLRAEGLPERKKRPKRGSKLDPFKTALHQLMADGIYNAEVLWERIRQQGYSGGKTCERLREAAPSAAPSARRAALRDETGRSGAGRLGNRRLRG